MSYDDDVNPFEIAARTTKAYHLVHVLEPVLRSAAGDGSVADLCARLDDEAWQLAAKRAEVNAPSDTTKETVVEILRRKERIAPLPPVTSEQIAGNLTSEQSAAPLGASTVATAQDLKHDPAEADHAAHSSSSGVRRGYQSSATIPTAAGTSPTQDSIFDSGAAVNATDEAIERVADNADVEWRARALEAVRRVALRKQTFIVDEVWAELGEEPAEPRAMGAVMRAAAKAGLIVGTKEWHASERVTAHRNPRKVWQSLIVRQAAS